MWSPISGQDKKKAVADCTSFMEDTEQFGRWMIKVSKEWINSSEHNLTATNSNRRAWIGQAACCMGMRSPEDVTREAWYQLTEWQRKLANKKADIAIELWENDFLEKTRIQEELF